MKKRLVWIVTVLVVSVTVASVFLLRAPSFLWPCELVPQTEAGLPEGETILVRTAAGDFGVRTGDVLSYLVEVLYNPVHVSEIDKTGLDKSVNLKPFDVKDIKKTEFDLDHDTRVYRIEYELQSIDTKVDTVYEFPAIVVQYKPHDGVTFVEETIVPESIYVAPRLPPDLSNLQLRPISGEIEDPSRKYPPPALWTLGGLIAVLGIAIVAPRDFLPWRKPTNQEGKIDSGNVLWQAYRSIYGNVAIGAEPRSLFHQMDHTLRIVLAQKEGFDWLEEADLNSVSSGIRPSVISLFEKCQEARGAEVIEQREVEEALRQMDDILKFYFGEEMEAWRN
ncbi:MAG: hypothetical protein ABID54_08760 [Pseudomonadota bacterium]